MKSSNEAFDKLDAEHREMLEEFKTRKNAGSEAEDAHKVSWASLTKSQNKLTSQFKLSRMSFSI